MKVPIMLWTNNQPIMQRIQSAETLLSELFEDINELEKDLKCVVSTSPKMKTMVMLIDDYLEQLNQIKNKAKNLLHGFAELKNELTNRRLVREKTNQLKQLDKPLNEAINRLNCLQRILDDLCQEADELA
jgi:DNA repair exonuclease SbcCD ATPase subunit